MRTTTIMSVALVGLLATAQAQEAKPEATREQQVRTAIESGLSWLAEQQKEDGSWSNSGFPALTALPLEAFAHSSHARKDEIVLKAVGFIRSCVQDDGGIYVKSMIPGKGGLGTYNTAICMTALHALGDRAFTKTIQDARKYVAGTQLAGDDGHAGGFGYGRSRWRRSSDLLNTMHATEAMRLTQGVEDLRPKGEQRVDLNWDKAIAYVERLQNKPESGEDEAGGFFYGPGKSGAGETTNAKGEVVFRSYGSITYAGMLALIYANVGRDDARVRSAVDWAANHWSLEENPGLGAQGMYFFYNVLAKALSAYGGDEVPRKQGESIAWKAELADKLLELKKTDPESGHTYWFNESGRYWENNPVLVTAYCVLALQML